MLKTETFFIQYSRQQSFKKQTPQYLSKNLIQMEVWSTPYGYRRVLNPGYAWAHRCLQGSWRWGGQVGIRSYRLLQNSEGLSLDVGGIMFSMLLLFVNSPIRKDLVTAQNISSTWPQYTALLWKWWFGWLLKSEGQRWRRFGGSISFRSLNFSLILLKSPKVKHENICNSKVMQCSVVKVNYILIWCLSHKTLLLFLVKY